MKNIGIKLISDNVVDRITCTVEGVIELLFCLCGEYISPSNDDKLLLQRLLKTKTSFNYQQINEILLLLNQDRMNKGFYEFFFGSTDDPVIDFKKLKEGVKGF